MGCDHLEVMMRGYADRHWLADNAESVRGWLEEYDVDLLFHLPHGTVTDIGSSHEHLQAGAIKELKACIDVASEVGAEKGVLHAQSTYGTPRMPDQQAVRRNSIVRSLDELEAFATDREFELCVENVIESTLSTTDFDVLFDRTDVSMTFDTGKALAEGMSEDEIATFIDEHADRVSHFHVNDQQGSGGHLPIGFGSIDFGTVLEPLRTGEWSATLSVEVGTLEFDYIDMSLRKLERWV